MTRQELLKIAQSWFTEQGWKPFKFQKDTWKAYLQKKNGLLNAPTGSGKTYALWVPIVLNYIKNNPDYKTRSKKGLKAIWITPLRALSVEIEQAAERFARGLGTNLTVGIRTGDTSQKERAAQKKSMPATSNSTIVSHASGAADPDPFKKYENSVTCIGLCRPRPFQKV